MDDLSGWPSRNSSVHIQSKGNESGKQLLLFTASNKVSVLMEIVIEKLVRFFSPPCIVYMPV